MSAALFHPLGVTILAGSLLVAGAVRFLPGAGGLSTMAPWILFCGAMGLVGVVALAGILTLLLCAPPVSANGRITPSFLTMWT